MRRLTTTIVVAGALLLSAPAASSPPTPIEQIGNSAVAGLQLARAAERGASMGENTRLS